MSNEETWYDDTGFAVRGYTTVRWVRGKIRTRGGIRVRKISAAGAYRCAMEIGDVDLSRVSIHVQAVAKKSRRRGHVAIAPKKVKGSMSFRVITEIFRRGRWVPRHGIGFSVIVLVTTTAVGRRS
jgi:hypothetical protein